MEDLTSGRPHDDSDVLEIAHINRAGTPVGLYRPGGAEGTALYLHGGGWVLGGIDSYEEVCCEFARRSRAIVAALDYSLAPDGHHPAQIKEVMAVMRYFRRSGRPVGLAGDGVGAYLAVQTAVAATRKVVPIVGLALVYPPIGPPRDPASPPAGGGSLQTQWDLYVPNLPGPDDPSLWLDELDLAGLPPTFIVTAEEDPLRPDAVRLRDALAAAGVAVELITHPGPPHDFLLPRAPRSEVDAALAEAADFLGPRLGIQPLVWSKPGGGIVS
jgi:acetyl esterase